MSIAGDLIRGHTDAIILARLLQGDSYGYEINKMICTFSSGIHKESSSQNGFPRTGKMSGLDYHVGVATAHHQDIMPP